MQDFSIASFREELIDILDWWVIHLPDETDNGFIGRIDSFGKAYPNADRGSVMNSRILWAFSAASRLGNPEYIPWARYAYDTFTKNFIDPVNGGVYWMVNSKNKLVEDKKQVYAQAFGIYACCEYYLLSKNQKALDLARQLFDLLEQYAKDEVNGGYFEAFSQEWGKIDQVRLSEKEGDDAKTMNTHLHILEAYTHLYRCTKDNDVASSLSTLVKLYSTTFVEEETGRIKLFFDETWNENFVYESYGHEIESAWLLNEAAEVLGDKVLMDQVQKTSLKITEHVLRDGIDSQGAIYNDKNSEGHLAPQRDWWPQAEAVVGFVDAYDKTGNDVFLAVAKKVWVYIQKNMLDLELGEWVWGRMEDGTLVTSEDKAGPWKAPYHNSRMCIEMIRRINKK